MSFILVHHDLFDLSLNQSEPGTGLTCLLCAHTVCVCLCVYDWLFPCVCVYKALQCFASTQPLWSSHTQTHPDPIFLYRRSPSSFASDDSRLCLTAADQRVTAAAVFLIIPAQEISVFVGVGWYRLCYPPPPLDSPTQPISEIDCFCLVIGVVQVRLTCARRIRALRMWRRGGSPVRVQRRRRCLLKHAWWPAWNVDDE